MFQRRLREMVALGAMIGVGGPRLVLAADFERTIPAEKVRQVTVGLTSGDVWKTQPSGHYRRKYTGKSARATFSVCSARVWSHTTLAED